jgi:hypothetical protein
MQQGHAAGTCSKDMQQGHAGLHFKDMQQGHKIKRAFDAALTWARRTDIQQEKGHVASKHSMDMQYVHVTRACRIEKRHGCSPCCKPVIMSMPHGMLHVHDVSQCCSETLKTMCSTKENL